jgi:hypothetical protein
LKLDLDAPGAAAALSNCYRLLRRWAAETENEKTADVSTVGSQITPTALDADPQQTHAEEVLP